MTFIELIVSLRGVCTPFFFRAELQLPLPSRRIRAAARKVVLLCVDVCAPSQSQIQDPRRVTNDWARLFISLVSHASNVTSLGSTCAHGTSCGEYGIEFSYWMLWDLIISRFPISLSPAHMGEILVLIFRIVFHMYTRPALIGSVAEINARCAGVWHPLRPGVWKYIRDG